MRLAHGTLGLLFLFGAAHANPAAEKQKVPTSDEEAITMAKQECAKALAPYGPEAEKLEWHVSQHDGRWFVSAEKGPYYFMAVFPKFRPCIAGIETN